MKVLGTFWNTKIKGKCEIRNNMNFVKLLKKISQTFYFEMY